MKLFILVLILFLNLNAEQDYQKVVNTISEHAIRFGNGPAKVYTFVDPMCPMSKAFIELITSDDYFQKKNSYYIFLYRLPMFQSDKLIQYIYQSKTPLETLKDVMIYEDYDDLDNLESKPETQEFINKIANVGKELNIKARPFLLSFEAGSSYCKVSSGTAPCLEENDFKE